MTNDCLGVASVVIGGMGAYWLWRKQAAARRHREPPRVARGLVHEITVREMIPTAEPGHPMIVGFGELEEELDAFEKLLEAHGEEIRPGSELERACYAARQIVNAHAGRDDLIEDADAVQAGQRVAGIWLLVRAVLAVAKHPKFALLLPHLRLLNDASALLATPGVQGDDAGNKLLETMIATACLSADLTELALDHPIHSSGGTNPDVLARWERWPRLWGFAAKMVVGDSPITLYQNIEKAAKQVRASRADRGFVAVSFKNRLAVEVGFRRPDGTA